MNIGQKIKSARKEAKLTQKELAVKSGLGETGQGIISRIERNKIDVSDGLINEIGEKLGLDLNSGKVVEKEDSFKIEGGLELVKQVNFNGMTMDFYQNKDKDCFMTRKQIGQALSYSNHNKAIDKIHRRHIDRLDKYSTTTKLGVTEGNRIVEREVVVYNQKGIFEICRWSNQDNANNFIDFVWEVMEEINKTGSYNQVEKEIEKVATTPEEELIMKEINSLKTLCEMNPSENLYSISLNQKKQELKQLRQDQRLDELEDEVKDMKDVLLESPKDYRGWINRQFGRICTEGKEFSTRRTESYRLLNKRANCNLKSRLTNLKKRLEKRGHTATQVNKANYLDVIEKDSRLAEIYQGIVKEMVVKYN